MGNVLNILKYINGTLPSKDRDRFRLWLDTSRYNHNQYSLIKKISESSLKAKDIRLFDEEKAWSDFLARLDEEKSEKVVSIGRKRFMRIFSVAASLIFLYFAFNFFFNEVPSYNEFVCVKNIDTVQLADGSVIFTKKGTRLKYFTRLKKSDSIRFIELDGVATFDVAPNKQIPFVVKAGKAGVSVLGTSFLLETNSSSVKIENFEGLVRFYEWSDETNNLLVKKGEKAVFDGSKISSIKKKKKSDVIKKEIQGEYHKVEYVIDYILGRFETRVSTAPYADIRMDDNVFVDLNQPLKKILSQLDTTSVLKFRKTCKNCYEIRVLRSNY